MLEFVEIVRGKGKGRRGMVVYKTRHYRTIIDFIPLPKQQRKTLTRQIRPRPTYRKSKRLVKRLKKTELTPQERKLIPTTTNERCKWIANRDNDCRWFFYNIRLLHEARSSQNSQSWQSSCKVAVVDESWTSKACSGCGLLNHRLGGSKVFHCNECDANVDRDANGVKNILLRNANALEITSSFGAYPF